MISEFLHTMIRNVYIFITQVNGVKKFLSHSSVRKYFNFTDVSEKQEYEQVKNFYRMARLRRMRCDRQQAGHRQLAHQALVYLYFFPYDGVAADRIYDTAFLDEHQTLCILCKKKPA